MAVVFGPKSVYILYIDHSTSIMSTQYCAQYCRPINKAAGASEWICQSVEQDDELRLGKRFCCSISACDVEPHVPVPLVTRAQKEAPSICFLLAYDVKSEVLLINNRTHSKWCLEKPFLDVSLSRSWYCPLESFVIRHAVQQR